MHGVQGPLTGLRQEPVGRTMVTTSWCLTEILKSLEVVLLEEPASQVADSTSASGVALPYFLSRRLSRASGVDADA